MNTNDEFAHRPGIHVSYRAVCDRCGASEAVPLESGPYKLGPVPPPVDLRWPDGWTWHGDTLLCPKHEVIVRDRTPEEDRKAQPYTIRHENANGDDIGLAAPPVVEGLPDWIVNDVLTAIELYDHKALINCKDWSRPAFIRLRDSLRERVARAALTGSSSPQLLEAVTWMNAKIKAMPADSPRQPFNPDLRIEAGLTFRPEVDDPMKALKEDR